MMSASRGRGDHGAADAVRELGTTSVESPPTSTPIDPSWVRVGAADPSPLVALHTWTEEAHRYAALSTAMGGAAIVSILAPSSDTGPLPRRVEQWVDHCDVVLRAAPVEPPYRLIGWSFGGVVAVELARRLKERGVDVSFVGMIDTTRPRRAPLSGREYVWYHLGAAAAMADDHERLPYLTKRGLSLANRRFPRLGAATRTTLERAGLRNEVVHRPSEKPTDPLKIAIHTSYLNYRGAPVPFPVSLYACQRSLARSLEPALRWNGSLHGGFELVTIPGGHFTLWEPEHIDAVGTAITRSLARVGDAGTR